MTHQADDSKPIAAMGKCPFFIRAYLRTSTGVAPEWEIVESHTLHTCELTANRSASRKRKNPGLSSAAVATILPAALVCDAQYGKRASIVHNHLASRGLSASKDIVAHCTKLAVREQPTPLNDDDWRALAAYINEFSRIDSRNQSHFETSSTGHFHRGILIPGSAIDLIANGFLSSVVTADFSHAATTTTEADAIAAAASVAGEGEGLASAATPAAARPRGRPRTTTMDLGRLAVLVGRSYIKTTVLLAVAVVPSETLEQAEWLFAEADKHLRMTEQWGHINMFLDRGHAINAAANNVFGDRVFVAHCFPHFKRNVATSLAKRKLTPLDKNEILTSLAFAAYSTTAADFSSHMNKIASISRDSYDEILMHEPRFWSQAYLPFNTLGNITSNDAEGRFGTVADVKNSSSLFTTLKCLLEAESNALSTLSKHVAGARCNPSDPAVPQLRKDLAQLGEDARFCVLVTRPSEAIMTVRRINMVNTEHTVDLRTSDRRTWCTCGRNAHSALPCEHVLFAVERSADRLANSNIQPFICQQAKQSVVAGLLAGGSVLMTPTSTAVQAGLEEVSCVLRPAWVTVTLPMDKVPEGAMQNIAGRELGRRSGASATWAFSRGPRNSRTASQGESELVRIERQRPQGAENLRVRVQLARDPTALEEPTPVPRKKGSSANRLQRRCHFCKALGHYQKACPLRQAAATTARE